jgi:hypothetical protein
MSFTSTLPRSKITPQLDSLTPRWAVETHLGKLFDSEAREEEEEDAPATAQTILALAALPLA